MKQITIKKSDLAMKRGLGKTMSTIAKEYGITLSELSNVMIQLGMKEDKSGEAYTIQVINDVDISSNQLTLELDPDIHGVDIEEDCKVPPYNQELFQGKLHPTEVFDKY